MSELIDFGQVPAATAQEFLEPGMYRLKVNRDKTKVEEPVGKTPYLSVQFVNEGGSSLTEKFFLTAKALPRLQYLHEAWFSKKLDIKFKSFTDIGKYFVNALTSKIVTRPMIVGGKIAANGKFYSGLPYSGFVVADESQFEEGAFAKDSDQYNRVVKKEKPNPAVAQSDDVILPGTDSNIGSVDDNPW
jgi:hypothetical protein